MRFAKLVFRTSGVIGVLLLAPLYFMFDVIARQSPPAITHPQFYYGFAALGLVWQAVFLVIATDPARFRPMMIPAVLEKAGWVLTLAVLRVQNRIRSADFATCLPDAIMGVFFIIAFWKTGAAAR